MTHHFIGIGGIGMSALAQVLLDRKQPVTGSDLRESALVTALRGEGASVDCEQSGAKVTKESTVVYSTAVPSNNMERQRAEELGCRVLHRADLLAELMQGYKVLAVAGTHGKTTTSALLAWVLLQAGLDPAFAIGGILPELQRNGRHGTGEYFVAEADESDGSFTKFHAEAAIVTGVEGDHLDYYGSFGRMSDAYEQFFSQTERLFWCADDPYLRERRLPGTSYNARNVRPAGFSVTFDAELDGQSFVDIELALAGRHNALNAAGVMALALSIGVDEKAIRSAFQTFPGVGRRCQKRGDESGILVLDDYAHHPSEVKTTLEGIRAAIGPRRLIAVFQPHRYTRLQHCLDEFDFYAADRVFITDVYSAGEVPIEGVDAQALIAKHPDAEYLPGRKVLEEQVRRYDVVVMMGAGDITKWAEPLTSKPLRVALLCGGTSLEHDVSLMSAGFFEEHINRNLCQLEKIEVPEWPVEYLKTFDVVIPCLHGPGGENGTAAAVLETLDVPYVGNRIVSGAVAMDKALTKYVAQSIGVPTAPFVDLHRGDTLDRDIGFPVFVKAAHLGSTFGVIRVDTPEDLQAAIDEVFELDDRLIIEQMVVGRELEVSILETEELFIAPPGEVVSHGNVHTYDGKYTAEGNPTDFAPELPPGVADQIRSYSSQIFRALGCRGLARIDWFLNRDNQPLLNEVNPFPGCTEFSPFPKMLAHAGIPYERQIDYLIQHALRHAKS